MKNLILIVITFFLTTNSNSQEKKVELKSANTFQTGIGVVDMKKILSQSTAYQSIVEQFEDIRRKHRNTFTKQEDVIRDEESNLLKQKNILSKEVYADKVKQLNQKINELKSKQASDVKKFETEDSYWYITINKRQVRVRTSVLFDFNKFALAVYDQINIAGFVLNFFYSM